jgi:hypothetical protein
VYERGNVVLIVEIKPSAIFLTIFFCFCVFVLEMIFSVLLAMEGNKRSF